MPQRGRHTRLKASQHGRTDSSSTGKFECGLCGLLVSVLCFFLTPLPGTDPILHNKLTLYFVSSTHSHNIRTAWQIRFLHQDRPSLVRCLRRTMVGRVQTKPCRYVPVSCMCCVQLKSDDTHTTSKPIKCPIWLCTHSPPALSL